MTESAVADGCKRKLEKSNEVFGSDSVFVLNAGFGIFDSIVEWSEDVWLMSDELADFLLNLLSLHSFTRYTTKTMNCEICFQKITEVWKRSTEFW